MHHASDQFDWDDPAIATLRALWAEGHSTAEIGRRMGVSKNAVVGKSRRLGLEPRPTPIRYATGDRPKPLLPQPLPLPLPLNMPTLPPLASVAVPATTARAKLVTRLPAPARQPVVREVPLGTSACRWPIGDPGRSDFRFCDAGNVAGRPYCPNHCEVAYVKPRDRRDAA